MTEMTGLTPSAEWESSSAASMLAAEAAWLDRWSEGPTETDLTLLREGVQAPDVTLPDHTGTLRQLSESWSLGPALLLFWRHFGCSCGATRAARLAAEWSDYRDEGLTPVIIALGDPVRANAYRVAHELSAPVLCDPGGQTFRAYGVGHWAVERVLYDAPPAFLAHSRAVGKAFQDGRRRRGNPPVDDPWRSAAEFVISPTGRVRLAYGYQYCEDFPDPRVITTAARLGVR
jgi:peroxiredoxin